MPQLKVRIAHPGGGPFVRAAVKGYFQAGLLDSFWTTLAGHRDSAFNSGLKRLFPFAGAIMANRKIDDIPFELVRTYPFRELIRGISSRYLSATVSDLIWEWAELGFDRWVAADLHPELGLVHVFEHAGLSTLQRAKELGLQTIYEQPSAHHSFYTRLFEEQLRKYPELQSPGNQLLISDRSKRRNERREKELELADTIRCNSTFTKKTLIKAGVSPERISVIPLGFPPVSAGKRTEVPRSVIFLHAGVQRLTKGSHLLYKAWKTCNFPAGQAELWLIGNNQLPAVLRKELPGKVVIRNSIPHNELMKLYEQAHVLLAPSLADGFGMVITEAMSKGLPVIASENSGGPDLITHTENGFIIPAGNVEAIAVYLKWCVDNKEKLPEMGLNALERAKKWQWPDYCQAVARFAEGKIAEKESLARQ